MKFDWKRDLRRLLLVVVASAIIAVNLKMFVRPAEMYPGGMNGLSMLMQTIFFHLSGPASALYGVQRHLQFHPGIHRPALLGRKFTISDHYHHPVLRFDGPVARTWD